MFKKPRVYLDYAAATPLLPAAYTAMQPFLRHQYGNASAIHAEGRVAREAVERARALVALTLQIQPDGVTFVSGGTEANNLALIGTIEALHRHGRAYSDMAIATTAIEHPSVLETARALQRKGVVVTYVDVNEKGQVKLSALAEQLNEKTVIFSVAYANSEVGTIQKIHSIKKTLAAAEKKHGTQIFFHLDAAQAPLWLSCQFDALHADLLTLDVGKCQGPKGVGILVQSRRAHVDPVLFGGGQESGRRPGTEPVAGVVGASVALHDAQRHYKARATSVRQVRDAALQHLTEVVPNMVVNGARGEERLANNINISIPGLDTEFATVVADKHGFAVSTKSACAGAGGGESAVVKVLSGDPARARSTLRLSLSPQTTLRDLKRFASVLRAHIATMQTLTKD